MENAQSLQNFGKAQNSLAILYQMRYDKKARKRGLHRYAMKREVAAVTAGFSVEYVRF